MKPTKKQIEICSAMSNIIKTWMNTNDIDSPSHTTYIEEELSKIDDLTSNEYDEIYEQIRRNLSLVQFI